MDFNFMTDFGGLFTDLAMSLLNNLPNSIVLSPSRNTCETTVAKHISKQYHSNSTNSLIQFFFFHFAQVGKLQIV